MSLHMGNEEKRIKAIHFTSYEEYFFHITFAIAFTIDITNVSQNVRTKHRKISFHYFRSIPAEIGGLLGIALGASFLTILEIVEFAASVVLQKILKGKANGNVSVEK